MLNCLLSIFVLLTSATAFANGVIPIQTFIVSPQNNSLIAAPERFESSPGSPPLNTDDTGVPGLHGYEINFITDCDHFQTGRSCESGIDAAFGIGHNVQFRISKSRVQEAADGEHTFNGNGPTDAGFKYRFFQKGSWQMATFPSFNFDDGTRHHNADGSVVAPDGRSVYLPLIVTKDFNIGDAAYTVAGNIAYRKNLVTSNNDSTFTSIALGRGLSQTSRIMAEYSRDCNSRLNLCRQDVRVGWIKVIFPNDASKYETALFTSVGVGEDYDGTKHETLLVGLSVARKPDQ